MTRKQHKRILNQATKLLGSRSEAKRLFGRRSEGIKTKTGYLFGACHFS